MHDICITEHMSDSEIKAMGSVIRPTKRLRKNDYLFRQGDRVDFIYIVKFGMLKSFLSDADGVEQIVGFNFPGELVGMDSIEDRRHTSSAMALQDTGICKISWHDFNHFSEQCVHFRMQTMNIVSRELIHIHELIQVLSQKNVEQKLAYFLLMLSQKMSAQGYSDHDFNLSMSRDDIANFLGIAAAETISREFSELQKRGIVRVERRRIQILQLAELNLIAHHKC